MKVIVIYESKYGFTKGIAEFIAKKLKELGVESDARQVGAVLNLDKYDAFVIGSAVYMGHWMKDAMEFVMQNHNILSSHPVWLFSSGPLGNEAKDTKGQDLHVISEPKEIAQFRKTINPLEHRIFFGGLDSSKLGFQHRIIRKMPAGRALLPEGDFRDWGDIEAWTITIARTLQGLHRAL